MLARRSCLGLVVLVVFGVAVSRSPRAAADDPLDEDGPALPAGAVLLGPRGLDFSGAVGPWTMLGENRIALGNGRRIRIFDANTRKEVRSWVSGRRFNMALVASPDGRRLASVDAYFRHVHIWDADTGKELKEFNPHRGYATDSLHFSADGKYVSSVGSERDPNTRGLTARWDDWGVRVSDVETGKDHPRFVGGLPGAHGPAFSPDGKWFGWVNGGGANSVSVRPLAGGDDVGFNVDAEGQHPFAFSPNGKLIAIQTKGGGLVVVDVATGKGVRRFKPEDELPRGYDLHQSVRFGPDNRTVLTYRKYYRGTLSTNHVRVRDVEDGTSRVFMTDSPVNNGLLFAKDGKSVFTLREDRNLQSWNLATGKEEPPLPGHTAAVQAVAITADGKTAATAGRDGTVRVWNAATGAELHVLKLAGAAVGVAFVDAGKGVVAADATGDVFVWEAATGKAVKRFAAHKGGVTSLAVSPDATVLATGGADATIRLWATAAWAESKELAAPKGKVLGVWFAGGKQLLSMSADGPVVRGGDPDGEPYFRLWDLPTGREVPGYDGLKIRATTAVVVSADGTRAVSHRGPGNDGTIQEWELATGRQLAKIGALPEGAGALPRAFSPDGSRVIAVPAFTGPGGGANVHVLDSRTWTSTAALKGHFGWMNSAAFSADGRFLVTGADDGKAIVWDLAKHAPGK